MTMLAKRNPALALTSVDPGPATSCSMRGELLGARSVTLAPRRGGRAQSCTR